jgi:hypothetical protein
LAHRQHLNAHGGLQDRALLPDLGLDDAAPKARCHEDRQRAALRLTSWVTGTLSEPFHITGFWPAFWGAIIVALVSWLLSITLGDKRHDREPS